MRPTQVHGNVCLAAVVVTETLDWRLHAFDVMSEYSEERPPEGLVAHAFMLADQYKPEEVRKGNWELLRQAPPWCVSPASRRLPSSLTGRAQGGGCLGRGLPGAGSVLGAPAGAHGGAARFGACAHGALPLSLPICISSPRRVSQALHKEYQRLLGSAPARRLSPAKMLGSALGRRKCQNTSRWLAPIDCAR